mgnify:CR=1 FL=1
MDVTGSNPLTTQKRYSAIFLGGKVGIGTSAPEAELHVSGDIIADNLRLDGELQADAATFNRLTVNLTASLNAVTVNNLVVLGTITANTLVLDNSFIAPDGEFSTLNAKTVSVNGIVRALTVTVNNLFTANKGEFFQSVGIGLDPPTTGLEVSGDIKATQILISDGLFVDTATINVNSGDLFANNDGKVGIGTTIPDSLLHVSNSTTGAFDSENNLSWATMRVQKNGNTAGLASGIVLVPDNNSPSASIGSGIAAIRTNSLSSQPGSHLVFITDPDLSAPAERMRITNTGRLGLGTTTPTTLLDVAGAVNISDDLTISDKLYVKEITSNSTITINPNGTLYIADITSIDAKVQIEQGLFIKSLANTSYPAAKADYGGLYVDENVELIFIDSNGITRNISKAFTGDPGRIAFFNSQKNLDDTALMFWDRNINEFQIGTSNAISRMAVVSTLNNTTTGNIAFHSIEMNIDNRTTIADTSTLTGMDVQFYSLNPDDIVNFGRLGDSETAIGLNVDLRNLEANYQISGTAFDGYKYAGVFQGANVGIGTAQPAAALHIAAERPGPGFIVDVKKQDLTIDRALVVSSNSFVGIGVTDPDAKLSVVGVAGIPVFHLKDSGGNSKLFVSGNVGIGTTTPATDLEVIGTVSANSGAFTEILASTMNIGSNALVVNNQGVIGFGTASPQGNIEFYKAFTSNTGSDFTSQRMRMIIDGDTAQVAGGSFSLNQDITGLDVNFESQTNASTLGDESANLGSTGIGVNVDLSKVVMAPTSNLVGFRVDVSNEIGRAHV